jgi:ATP-dependent RNA helicase SUPV3L1/SUV3
MRRLRENTMLETEIKKSGEVMTEGHVIGRLEGFSFTPDTAAEGSEAKALQAAARSALAGEIDARARRLSQAPDREFILTIDGTLRWVGEAVAKLAAGDDVLRPRLRIVADEQLTGAPREAVQTRLDLWLKTHIERLLGPLFELTLAEDLTGIARGIAFQLVESLGVLERSKVAEEVKSLEQPARATLRKHGVRFGAYHIYAPALLKPAPRALAVQLWALKHGGADHGLENLQHLAASGRTSIPVDEKMPHLLYRTAGYRVCGARAIRVDILERLADLIRPALAWHEGAAGERPAAAVDGRAFMVTGAMTSLTGASGEDFASILRALGYRMEKRPKPAAAPPATPAAEVAETTPAQDVSPVDGATLAAAATDVAETVIAVEPSAAPSSVQIPVPDYFPPAETTTVAVGSNEAAPVSPQPETTTATLAEPAAMVVANPGSSPETTVAAVPVANAEPEMIEVWRPGRPDGPRRKRENGKRPPRRRREQPAQRPESQTVTATQATPAEVTTTQVEPAQRAARPERERTRDRDHDRERDRKEKQGRPRRPERDARGGHGERGEQERGGARAERGHRRRDRRDRDDDRSPRTWTSDERRGKEPDPNSPFAKLLALKEQLETNAKERR